MRIVYLIDQLKEHGGIEKIVTQKINYWIEYYHFDVLLVTYRQGGEPFIYPVNPKVQHIDLAINYDLSKSYFHPRNLVKAKKHFSALKKLLAGQSANVIISAGFTPDQYFLPYISKHIPKIKELHGSGFSLLSHLGGYRKKLFDQLGKYDKVVVLNTTEAAYFPTFPTEVIPNFISLNAEPSFAPRQKVIIAAGRIAPVKQFDHLIKAWALIANSLPEWQLHIYGAGDAKLMQSLQNLIRQNNLQRQTKLAGPTTELFAAMQQARVYAMTSATECFPMVLLEAQAAGLPVISYRSPHGPEHIIHNEQDGVLTKYNDISEFADQLSALLHDEEKVKTLAHNASLNANRYKIEMVMAKWNSLIVDLQK